MNRLGLLLTFALLGVACGVPIKVVRIDKPTAPTQGVRYRIKRPDYKVSLRINPDAKDRYEVVVAQVLREAVTYEATTHPNPFADTEISIVTDDPGALTSFSAGETDKSLETITAAIGLATQLAVLANPCEASFLKSIADLQKLSNTYDTRERYAKGLETRIDALTIDLHIALSANPVDPKRVSTLIRERLRLVRALAETQDDIKGLKARSIPLTREDYTIIVKSGLPDLQDRTLGSGKCLQIVLTPKEPS